MRHVVARVDEFEPGSRRIVHVGRREIGVFREGDQFFALRNRCPHQGGPLALGRVFRPARADAPGQITLGDSHFIACPWHAWCWDMETGEAYAPADPRVRSYSVAVVSGCELDCDPAAGGSSAPERAETFPIRIEEDYVVLDV